MQRKCSGGVHEKGEERREKSVRCGEKVRRRACGSEHVKNKTAKNKNGRCRDICGKDEEERDREDRGGKDRREGRMRA